MVNYSRLYLFSLLVVFPVFFPGWAFGQQSLIHADSVYLMERATLWTTQDYLRKQEALEFAKRYGWPVKEIFDDGTVVELQYLDADRLPVYYRTRNAESSLTTGTSQLQPGGLLRLHLSGEGFTAGVWDEGRIQTTHPELIGRVHIRDDGALSSNHATHVAGTIAAAGVDPEAKGMAPMATVDGYDWNNDLSEMAQAAANGLLISNHSYGIELGWIRNNDGDWRWTAHPDSIRDYRFGFYSSTSRQLDEIAYHAPYYTIVWAAGNDRSDTGDGTRPPDGPYDAIGPESVAKNVLSIGSVNKIPQGYSGSGDVRISTFSSFGPADDGRVKPDLVAPGRNVYSTVLDGKYGQRTGTSMAAPVVSGSLLLLQQLYSSLNDGAPMTAATLKSLTIHTVNQTGSSPGPDYQFGWGLLNAEKAARMIVFNDSTHYFIREETLHQGTLYTLEFEADGSGDIIATLVWTDPPGKPVSPAMNPRDPMLVNDLDMRIVDSQGQEHFPWLLDPEQPQAAPVQDQDNAVDNVEKILIKNPAPGTYTLRITHKDTLYNGYQNFSLCLQTKDIVTRNTFFWIGGSGFWHDPQNWSLRSGGEAANEVPGIMDHVVFDDQSFNSNGDSHHVILTEDAFCYSVNWTSEEVASLIFDDHTLHVFNSFISSAPSTAGQGPGTIKFSGNHGPGVVTFSEGFGQNIRLQFDHEAGFWKINSGIEAHAIELLAGHLEMIEQHVRVNEIITGTDSSKILDISGSDLSGLRFVDLDDANLVFIQDGSSLTFDDPAGEAEEDLSEYSVYLNSGGRTIDMLINNSQGLNIYGEASFYQLYNHSGLMFHNDQSIHHLSSLPGSHLSIQSGCTLTIIESFDLTGSQDDMIYIASFNGTSSWLTSDSQLKFCAEYLDVRDVSIAGNSVFGAGLHSHISGTSTGWKQEPCEDILYADFNVVFACEGAMALFEDVSTGHANDWLWQFDLDDPLMPSSVLQHPTYIYNKAGNVRVRLSIGDGVNSHTRVKTLDIKPNTLPKPQIDFDGNRFFTYIQGYDLQWYLDGNPIPGATSTEYVNTLQTPGTYYLTVSDDQCNLMSDHFLYYPVHSIDFVISSQTGAPITDAQIILNDIVYDRGKYRFDSLFPDNYNYEIIRPGFRGIKGVEHIIEDDRAVSVRMVKDPLYPDYLNLYPNPASLLIRIESNEPFKELLVHNIAGKLVLSASFPSNMVHNLDVSTLNNGVYIIQVVLSSNDVLRHMFYIME